MILLLAVAGNNYVRRKAEQIQMRSLPTSSGTT